MRTSLYDECVNNVLVVTTDDSVGCEGAVVVGAWRLSRRRVESGGIIRRRLGQVAAHDKPFGSPSATIYFFFEIYPSDMRFS